MLPLLLIAGVLAAIVVLAPRGGARSGQGASAGGSVWPALYSPPGDLPPPSCVVGAVGTVYDDTASPPSATGPIMSCDGACVRVRDTATGDVVCGDLSR